MGRLLAAASAPQSEALDEAEDGASAGVRFDEQVRGERRRQAGVAIEGAVAASLKSWREVIMSPPDVASGRYQQAELAADLWQVNPGEGTDDSYLARNRQRGFALFVTAG